MSHQNISAKTHRNALIAGVLAGATWGLVFLFPRLVPEFSPLSQMVLRYLMYGFFSFVFSFRTILPLLKQLTQSDWRRLAVFSLQSNILYYVCLSSSVTFAGIAPATLIIGTLPVTIALMSQNDAGSLSWRVLLIPIGCICLGIVCISTDLFLHADSLQSSTFERVLALGFAFSALILWTLFAVNNARYLRRAGSFSPHDWSNLVGVCTAGIAVIAAGLGLVMAQFSPNNIFALTTSADLPWLKFITVGAFIAFAASWLGNSLWNKASQVLPISLTGQLIVSESLFSLLYGFIYDARLPRALETAAICLSLVGVFLAIRLHAPDKETLHSTEQH